MPQLLNLTVSPDFNF